MRTIHVDGSNRAGRLAPLRYKWGRVDDSSPRCGTLLHGGYPSAAKMSAQSRTSRWRTPDDSSGQCIGPVTCHLSKCSSERRLAFFKRGPFPPIVQPPKGVDRRRNQFVVTDLMKPRRGNAGEPCFGRCCRKSFPCGSRHAPRAVRPTRSSSATAHGVCLLLCSSGDGSDNAHTSDPRVAQLR